MTHQTISYTHDGIAETNLGIKHNPRIQRTVGAYMEPTKKTVYETHVNFTLNPNNKVTHFNHIFKEEV